MLVQTYAGASKGEGASEYAGAIGCAGEISQQVDHHAQGET